MKYLIALSIVVGSANLAAAVNVASFQSKQGLENYQSILKTAPQPSGTAPSDKLFYDIVIDGVCDPGSIVETAGEFIDGVPGKLGDQTVGLFVQEKRAVALTVTISFADSVDKKTVTLPLIAAATTDGSPQTISCNKYVMRGIPRGQSVLITTDLRWTTTYQAGNAGALVKDIGDALIGVSALGPHVATAGFGLVVMGAGVDRVSQATINFLTATFGKREGPALRQYRFDPDQEKLAYGPKGHPKFIIRKESKDTNLDVKPGQSEQIPQAIIQAFGIANSLDQTFAKNGIPVAFVTAKTSKLPRDFDTLCTSVRQSAGAAYGGDPGAVALAVYYYVVQNSDTFRPLKVTCLTTAQVKLLSKLGFATPPYVGAFDPDLAGKQPSTDDAGAVSDAVFNDTKDLLTEFARLLKELPERLASKEKSEQAGAKSDLADLFDESVAVTADPAMALIDTREAGMPRSELIDKISSWGNVSHFGCYVKPKSTLALGRKITGETLVQFQGRPFIAHVQVGVVKNSNSDGSKIVRLELSRADADIVIRLMEGRTECGRGAERWNPKKDFDSLTTASSH